jgi:hypothetical protein
MADKRRFEAFAQGAGVEQTSYCCAECGYTSTNRRNFKSVGEGEKTCSTGHYEDKEGNLKRAINPYARRR